MRRGLGALAVLLVLATTACGDGGEPAGADAGGTGPTATTSEDVRPGDEGDGGSTDGGDENDAGEDLEDPLPQAGGKAQADLPGLLMGGEDFTLVGDAWCGLASIQSDTLPDGLTVTITGVTVQTEGAAVVGTDCGTPSCRGAVLDAGGLSCWVAVRPPDPGTELVDVSFAASATCRTQQQCDEFTEATTLYSVWSMCHPPGDVGYDCDAATAETSEAPTDEPGETETEESSETPGSDVTGTPEEVTQEPADGPVDEPADELTDEPTGEQVLP
ncbi:hypothetical protein ACFQ8T_00955 [Isoptericola sp. NPDC056618]|uniref:hypothetical protein n=1 Tax=Isoptericola sp. NPDC056618 TaxID=3345878 RepID=UPI0036A5D6C8